MKTISSNPPGVWGPQGRGFSMGVALGNGRVIHFSGQVAWDADENIVGLGDVEEQTRQCYRNITAVLESFGCTLQDLVAVTTYYLRSENLSSIQAVRSEFLAADPRPTSTSVMVAGLGHSDFLVEFQPIALIPSERFIAPLLS